MLTLGGTTVVYRLESGEEYIIVLSYGEPGREYAHVFPVDEVGRVDGLAIHEVEGPVGETYIPARDWLAEHERAVA